jgi:hypothetical protein
MTVDTIVTLHVCSRQLTLSWSYRSAHGSSRRRDLRSLHITAEAILTLQVCPWQLTLYRQEAINMSIAGTLRWSSTAVTVSMTRLTDRTKLWGWSWCDGNLSIDTLQTAPEQTKFWALWNPYIINYYNYPIPDTIHRLVLRWTMPKIVIVAFWLLTQTSIILKSRTRNLMRQMNFINLHILSYRTRSWGLFSF